MGGARPRFHPLKHCGNRVEFDHPSLAEQAISAIKEDARKHVPPEYQDRVNIISCASPEGGNPYVAWVYIPCESRAAITH